jgi:hypothetical protein
MFELHSISDEAKKFAQSATVKSVNITKPIQDGEDADDAALRTSWVHTFKEPTNLEKAVDYLNSTHPDATEAQILFQDYSSISFVNGKFFELERMDDE